MDMVIALNGIAVIRWGMRPVWKLERGEATGSGAPLGPGAGRVLSPDATPARRQGPTPHNGERAPPQVNTFERP